jgi:hypothetical protein
MYLYERPLVPQRTIVHYGRSRWSHLCGLEGPRAGTLVLYVAPPDADDKKNKRMWSFSAYPGQREYEKALDKHLVAKSMVPAKGTTYAPMTSSSEIAKLASNAFEDLVLIVHSAHNGPAIGVNLAAGDWLKDDKVGDILAPLAFNKVTILGCDAVENKFAPSLAARLPKGSTIVAHKGGAFVIGRHFDPDKRVPGRMALTRVSSNFNLKAFKGGK